MIDLEEIEQIEDEMSVLTSLEFYMSTSSDSGYIYLVDPLFPHLNYKRMKFYFGTLDVDFSSRCSTSTKNDDNHRSVEVANKIDYSRSYR